MRDSVRLIRSMAPAVLALAVTGCGLLPAVPIGGYANVRGPSPRPPVPRADVNLSRENPRPDVFVGLAISGGGSRAATFGAATLEQLHSEGYLAHVNAISSVSGGGLPAAKFALDGEQIRSADEWRSFVHQMAFPYRTRWLVKMLLPQNMLKVSLTKTTRTDLMADVFDDQLFGGRTYADLGKEGPLRPKLFINATDTVGEAGGRFTFSKGNFNLLLSDLSAYPIAKAVAASAAFPGVFNPVTLHAFPTRPLARGEKSGFDAYHHLIDGGPSDNLGIEGLRDAAAAHFSRWSAIAGERGVDPKSFKCMVILVDAYPSAYDRERGYDESSRRGFVDYLVDRSFLDAFDALLTRRRADQLAKLGFDIKPSSAIAFFNSPLAQSSVEEYRVGDVVGLDAFVRPYE